MTVLEAADPGRVWPVRFTPAVRDMIIARDAVAGADSVPLCFACGQPIRMTVEIHHRRGKNPGDGRPSNGIATHGRLEAAQCHHTRIHGQVAAARANRWILSNYTGPGVPGYTDAVWCAWRGWIRLDDAGGWAPAEPPAPDWRT